MSIASAARLRNEMCFCILCIDGHENGDISGRIFNAYYRDAITFENGMEMVAKLEDVFDIFGYPHQTMDIRRSFRQITEAEEQEHDAEEEDSDDEDEDDDDDSTPQSNIAYIGLARAQQESKSQEADKTEGHSASQPSRPGMRLHVAPTTRLVKHNAVGRLATLRTRVMFRQNAEWQGNVKWMEADLSENFSSVLELMLLIDSIFEQD